ncbi:HAD-IA family hydrolase [Robiginitomaculum antarcticum]|uniref:HAD-IA family hydrolase n=1 Tax=Robiginitomaculum antarcticum TaxID=437507 RepID=UPI000370AF32|nr:HAD-IA family hydrolase [Robiginitomaculum antarcticum]
MSRASLVFDLDGTLVDTAPDLVRVLDTVVARHGVKAVNYNRIRNLIGFGARALITKALSDACVVVPDSEVDDMQAEFLTLYSQDIAQLSRPFDGVEETLAVLKRRGFDLSVATNKPGWLARPLLEALDMSLYFDTVIGGDEPDAKKPDAAHIYAACGHRATRPIVVIGDSPPDAGAARNAGATCILMSYGYSAVAIESLKADVILRKFREIPSALQSLLK